MSTPNWILDLSHGTKVQKEAFLNNHADKNVVMDLTCFDPQDFYTRFPQLKGVCSTLLSPNQNCEAHFRESKSEALSLLEANGLRPIETTLLVPGFTVARIMATIINEAYYSLEDKVATASDIDRAMRFGVNYPMGPFAWAKGKESIVATLLTTLLEKTGDERYRPAQGLKQ